MSSNKIVRVGGGDEQRSSYVLEVIPWIPVKRTAWRSCNILASLSKAAADELLNTALILCPNSIILDFPLQDELNTQIALNMLGLVWSASRMSFAQQLWMPGYRLTHQPSISLIKEFKVSLTTIFFEYHFSTMCGRGWKMSHYMIYSPFVSTGIEHIEIHGQTRLQLQKEERGERYMVKLQMGVPLLSQDLNYLGFPISLSFPIKGGNISR